MRIGLSFSRCVRDIVDGIVKIDDVLVVISRTHFDPNNDKQWQGIWRGYHELSGWSRPEWINYPPEDEAKFRQVTLDLLNQGKLFQPRQFRAHPPRLPYFWLETTLPSDELENNPAAKAAWEKFLSIAFLSGVEIQEGQG